MMHKGNFSLITLSNIIVFIEELLQINNILKRSFKPIKSILYVRIVRRQVKRGSFQFTCDLKRNLFVLALVKLLQVPIYHFAGQFSLWRENIISREQLHSVKNHHWINRGIESIVNLWSFVEVLQYFFLVKTVDFWNANHLHNQSVSTSIILVKRT